MMIVGKYLVAWGTTANCAKIREPSRIPLPVALTCAQANRRLFAQHGHQPQVDISKRRTQLTDTVKPSRTRHIETVVETAM